MKRKLLQKANLHGDGCDKIEIIEKKQEEILAQHIEIAYHFMMMAWSVDDSKIAFLDPKLIELCLLGVSHDVKDEDKAEYQSKHNQRCKVLLEMSQCDLVLCPIFSSGPSQHWTFMSIKGDRVRYYDTLSEDHYHNKVAAVQLLSLLRPLLLLSERANVTTQSGATCGFWVVRYIEEEIREAVEGQKGTAGWPDIVQWKQRLMSLSQSLQSELQKLKDDEASEEVKHAAVIEKAKSKAANLMKQLQSKKICAEAKASAQAELDKIPHLKRCYENLRPEYQFEIDKVRMNPRYVCGSCRWASSCWKCDPEKALSAYLKKEFGSAEVLEASFISVWLCCSL
jgi:hypothetical protein